MMQNIKQINIRHGVFETNSSSCHSISISEDSGGLLDVIYPNNDGIIELEGGEFGKPLTY
jgi:hypothetical protein